MGLVDLNELLLPAQRDGYAVGAFNYCNYETAQAIVEEGVALRAPVMFIIGPMEIPLLGAKTMVKIAESVAEEAGIPVCLHLDHATELSEVRECIEAGFPSVMMDASKHDFEENIRRTRAVVEIARPRGITVEAELGAVGRVDDVTVEGEREANLTDPSKAAEFVERTGVDALAMAIGNAHGLYTKLPQLDFERLAAIRREVSVPLVLHGGSGTPTDQLRRAIEGGICKVNVASEIGAAYLAAITNAISEANGKIWYTIPLMQAKAATRAVVGRWMKGLGSAGKR